MINLQTLLEFINFVTNKETDGNTMTIPQYNTLLSVVNMDFFKYRYGLPEEYRAGQPLPRMSYELTQKITDDLRHLKVRMGVDTPQMIVDVQGRADIPSNYVHFSSWGYRSIISPDCDSLIEKHHVGEVLSDAQVFPRLGNSITYPSKKDPVCVFYKDYIQFYPRDLKRVDFTYLRFPLTPYYATTVNSETDEYEYSEEDTIHLEYPADCFSDIASMILSYIGINLREQDLIKYAETHKLTGK